MASTGCGRLVFASSVTAYGSVPDHPEPYVEGDTLATEQPSAYASHKAEAELMIAAAGVEAVLPRVAVVVGRHVDNAVRMVFAAPVLAAVRGDDPQVQAVHQDDVGRFFVEACLGSRTGPVNLAASDVVTMDEAARLLGKRIVRVPEPAVKAFLHGGWALRVGAIDPGEFNSLRYLPIADTTRLREEWGFVPEYSTTRALADFRRSLEHVVGLGRFEVRRPGRRHRVDAVTRCCADAQGLSSGRKDETAATRELHHDEDDALQRRRPRARGARCVHLAAAGEAARARSPARHERR